MCPKVTEMHRKNLREKIIDIASKSFSKYGYDKTRMDDVAISADVAKGTLYLYFKSKEDLFTAISERNIEKLQNHFVEHFDNKEDLIHSIENFYNTFEHPDNKVFFEILSESSRNKKLKTLLIKNRKKVIGIIIAYLDLQKKRGLLKKDLESDLIAYILVNQYDGLRINNILGIEQQKSNNIWLILIKKLFY